MWQLLKSEEHFEQIFGNMLIGVAFVHLDGAWSQVNAALCDILGYGEGELLGADVRDIIHPEDVDAYVECMGRFENSQAAFCKMKKRYFHKYGHVVWALLAVESCRDEVGTLQHYVFQVEDISAQIEAERSNKTKDMFLANMSHELRTPLNSIVGLVRILMNEENIPFDHRRTLRIVDKSSSALLDIVNDILDISKIESGRVELEERPFNISGLMMSLVDQLGPLASKKGLVLRDNIEDLPMLIVMGDEFRLSRIVLNLASNAIKYTMSGHVSLSVGLRRLGEGSVQFVCSVADSGIGIPEDKIEHIFDKFTQADEAMERRFGGTGLGLNITKQLERDFMYDEAFDAHLSFYKEREQRVENVIMIADDDLFVRNTLRTTLSNYGRICEVGQGGSVGSQYLNHNPDVLLLDIHMPGKSGLSVVDEVMELDADAFIVVFSSDSVKENVMEAISKGAYGFLSKPVKKDKLIGYLQQAVTFC